MKLSRRSMVTAGALAAAHVAVAALPALASGSFTWTCQFTHRCVSRTWSTPNQGTHYITKTDSDCPGPGNQMRVRLVHEEFGPDTLYAWKSWTCGATDETRSWSSNQTGDFHFDIEKSDTTDTYWAWTVYGRTSYP